MLDVSTQFFEPLYHLSNLWLSLPVELYLALMLKAVIRYAISPEARKSVAMLGCRNPRNPNSPNMPIGALTLSPYHANVQDTERTHQQPHVPCSGICKGHNSKGLYGLSPLRNFLAFLWEQGVAGSNPAVPISW